VRLACLGVAVALVVSLAPQAATADPAIPSKGQISAARRAASGKADQVAAIKARLTSAQTELDRTQIAMATAGQAYDAALVRLDAARVSLRKAVAANEAAKRDVEAAQRAVGALVRSQVQSDAGLLQWASLLDGASPQDLLDQASVFNTVSASLDGLKRRLVRAQQVATTKQKAAADAEAEVARATADAAVTKNAAERAAATAQETVTGYAARKDRLLIELAGAEQVTVQLVRQRQAGLEALARARAEAKRKAAEAALRRREAARHAAEVRAAAAARARARAEATAERARKARAAARARAAEKSRSRSAAATTRHSSRSSAPRSVTPAASPGYSSSAASRAIGYARRQLGKPYVFGAVGPSSFDCSGLTMRAWQSAGRDIPRLAASQYFATRHISQGELRPGDLLFWGSTPSSIYHVALYIGDGKMIQAPRPGRSVEVQSIYYWISPSYFGRV
jgi:cell wall-associated NlpC family hydrolase